MTTADVTQAIDVDAPRERVWELLTDPAELPRWWPDAAELEPRVGGRSRVAVVHSGFADAPADAREAVNLGWSHFLPRLAAAA